jgi:hypothetical protein
LFRPGTAEPGTSGPATGFAPQQVRPAQQPAESAMHSIIYLVGLVVVVLAILSFFGLR